MEAEEEDLEAKYISTVETMTGSEVDNSMEGIDTRIGGDTPTSEDKRVTTIGPPLPGIKLLSLEAHK